MKRLLAVFIALVLLSTATPALAGHRHHRGHHGGNGAAVAGVLIGGVLLGHLLTRPTYGSYHRPYYRPYYRPYHRPYYRPYHRPYYRSYYRPYYWPTYPPAAVAYTPTQPVLSNCQPTTGTSIVNGRTARYAGTMCTNPAGQGYILDGSVRFLGYLQ